jgi:hypothetical protein
MKAFTLTEPWASLVVWEEKKWETRSRPNRRIVGARVAIHASKGFPRKALALCETSPFIEALARHDIEPDQFALGHVIGFVTFASCRPVEEVRDQLSKQELAFGDYRDGRFCYQLLDPEFIEPIPARGMLGFWEWRPQQDYYRNYAEGLPCSFPS